MHDLICSRCGNSFQSIQAFAKVCPNCKIGKCKICGKSFNRDWPYDQQTCSAECRKLYRRSAEIIEKTTASRVATLQKKYGVDNVSKLQSVRDKISAVNASDEVRSRREATCMKKYGVAHPLQNEDIKRHAYNTWMEHYGVPYPTMSDEIKKKMSDTLSSDESMNKRRATLMERYGVSCTNAIPGVREKMMETTTEHYGVPYYVLTEEYRHPKKSNVISKTNKQIAELFHNCGIETEFEYVIDNRSYDLHISNTNILIEIDPTYTHNCIGNHWDSHGTEKQYHINKTKLAEEHGYRCIHIFDWDDVSKVIDLVKNKNRIYARNCDIRNVSDDDLKLFLNLYHLQGACRGTKYAVGLYYNTKLVEVMTFGKPRYNKNYQWELLRLCTRSDYRIVGGASKLWRKFIADCMPESVISYCDHSKFNGSVYYELGMKLDHTTEPSKIWSNNNEKITDNLLRQRGYDQLFNANYGKGTDNEKLMIEHGWLPVYDCGQLVFTKNFTITEN